MFENSTCNRNCSNLLMTVREFFCLALSPRVLAKFWPKKYFWQTASPSRFLEMKAMELTALNSFSHILLLFHCTSLVTLPDQKSWVVFYINFQLLCKFQPFFNKFKKKTECTLRNVLFVAICIIVIVYVGNNDIWLSLMPSGSLHEVETHFMTFCCKRMGIWSIVKGQSPHLTSYICGVPRGRGGENRCIVISSPNLDLSPIMVSVLFVHTRIS